MLYRFGQKMRKLGRWLADDDTQSGALTLMVIMLACLIGALVFVGTTAFLFDLIFFT